jgi:hypothetical protein
LRSALSRSSLCLGFGEQLIYDLLDLSLAFETLHRAEQSTSTRAHHHGGSTGQTSGARDAVDLLREPTQSLRAQSLRARLRQSYASDARASGQGLARFEPLHTRAIGRLLPLALSQRVARAGELRQHTAKAGRHAL